MPFESFAEARGGSSAAPSAEVRRGSSAAPSAEVRRGSLAAPSAEVRRGSSVAPYAEVRRSSSTASSAEVRRGSSTAPYAEARRGSSVALFTAVQRGSSAELRWNLRLCLLLLVIVILAGCGRTLTEVDPCATTVCTCVFNTDCPDDFVCIDGVCVDRDDLAQCIANGARPEVCNGRDDDCDGRIDEALADRPCTREADGLSCPGTEICAGEAGFVCDAPVPSAEICDGIDNDCNGLVDELFVDDRGEYTTLSNCGACGIDCTQTILDADVTACVMTEQGPTCRVIACPPGTFPNSDETACLGLPDALCRPCVDDGDCLGPDSQCLTFRNDERGCGRNCGADSPYGIDCPEGYQCIDEQCRPILDTCLCGPALVGTTRSCRIDACDGFETCESVASGFDWGACDISAWRETCDGADNDCDGVIDNGFLNQQTGRYESDLHCGRCNNDCTARWAPEVDRAIGGCALDGPVPECRIESCTFETIGGIAFEWVDVNGEGDDGCECLRRQGNSTQDDPDLGPLETLTQGVVDQNCDGVDGVVLDALFVRANAPAGGDGTRLRPFQRIQEGLDRLRDTGRRYVLVAEGVYRERVVVPDGAEVYGGYSGDFLRREVL
ncbi:MAG: MopE-related protein, partial [Myxococcota bacterium]